MKLIPIFGARVFVLIVNLCSLYYSAFCEFSIKIFTHIKVNNKFKFYLH